MTDMIYSFIHYFFLLTSLTVVFLCLAHGTRHPFLCVYLQTFSCLSPVYT